MEPDDRREFEVGISWGSDVDGLCDRFKAAWKAGARPNIEKYLKDVSKDHRQVLFRKLMEVDIEYRRRAGEEPNEADYNELRSLFSKGIADTLPLANTKTSTEPQKSFEPPPIEFHPLRISCPHCRSMIEIVDDRPLEEIVCPSCGSHFDLVGDEALVFHTQGGTPHRRRRIGRFELMEQLGYGSFGIVWKAKDTQLDRTVAVKIPRHAQPDRERTEKFLREPRAAAQLKHPNIVSVLEIGSDGDLIYIVSDFIDGVSLADQLTGRRFTYREAAKLCAKIADALHFAHQKGIIHRDLKPSNVMLDRAGEPHLMDFGLAKREAGEVTMTMEGQILGIPAYMSPEQAKGNAHAADRRTDVYSLGVILFELLTGERPFRGNVRMLLKQVAEDLPPRPRKFDSHVPHDLETICLKCLAKQPSQRYSSAQEVAAELGRFLNREPILARPVGPVVRVWQWYYRNPTATMLTAGGYAVFVASVLIAWALMGMSSCLFVIISKPCQLFLLISALLLVCYVPMLCGGVLTLRGYVHALWIGVVQFLSGCAMSILGLGDWAFDRDVYGSQTVRMPLFTLLLIMSFIGLLTHVIALVSHFNKKIGE